jgi:DNA-binding response OmpR family regulator
LLLDLPLSQFGTLKDDLVIVEMLREMLDSDGRFEVKTATTGYDAGVLTEQFKPDLLVLDYMLPDINGNVVCQTVRQNSHLNGTKVIIVSGVVNRDEIEGLLEAGADDFIKKPFDMGHLMARGRALLEV